MAHTDHQCQRLELFVQGLVKLDLAEGTIVECKVDRSHFVERDSGPHFL